MASLKKGRQEAGAAPTLAQPAFPRANRARARESQGPRTATACKGEGPWAVGPTPAVTRHEQGPVHTLVYTH